MGVLPYIPVTQKQVTGGSGGRGKRGLWGWGVGWMGVFLVLREQAGQEGPRAPGQSPTGQPGQQVRAASLSGITVSQPVSIGLKTSSAHNKHF